ncbi:MAG: beta-lactamase family protein [Acidobacteria bacterium]|nr:beta-lactamase family protein [Acidobacteriota bacterium]
MIRLVPVGLVIAILLAIPCHAQNSLSSKVDEYLKAEMQNQRIPGLAVAIIKDGQVVYAKGHGMANVEHKVEVKPETIFQSGSVGKQFTAAAVMLLVEDGKIGLDDRIAKYFTDSPEHWKNITVRHLLTHTAGTTDYPPDFDFRRDYTEDELLKKAADIPLAFQPGERWSYSNMGYVMLGILIGKVTGKFYGDFLQERIFKPLGMATARIISEEDINPYGFGWMFREAGGRRLIEHGGSWQGFKSFIARYVDDKMTVIVFANLAQTNPDRIAHGVAAVVDSRLAVPDDQVKGLKVNAMIKDILTKCIDGSVSQDAFTPEARAELFPDKIRRFGEALKPFGAITSVLPGGRTEEDGLYSHRRYRIAFNGRSRMCRILLTKDDRISGLELLPE